MKIMMQEPKDWAASSRIPLLAVRTGSEVPETGMMVGGQEALARPGIMGQRLSCRSPSYSVFRRGCMGTSLRAYAVAADWNQKQRPVTQFFPSSCLRSPLCILEKRN